MDRELKFLFNATINVTGGGAKNSAVFIRQAIKADQHEWTFAVSSEVYNILRKWDICGDNVVLFEHTPAWSLKERRRLKDLQDQLKVDLVYTMAGPAYVRFSCPHIMGISNGYLSHVDLHTFCITRPFLNWFKDGLRIAYQSYYARLANHMIFQTETACKSFCRRLRYPENNTSVVSNAFDSDVFTNATSKEPSTFPKDFSQDHKLKILVPATYSPHKMLDSVPQIAAEASKICDPDLIVFLLTLDPSGAPWKEIEARARSLGVTQMVETVGAYNYARAAEVYSQADLVFVPSILETFSATYLEAFCSQRPLIASNLPFALEVCGNAACFVNPKDSTATAKAIIDLAMDPSRQQNMIESGKQQLGKYGSQTERHAQIISILERMVPVSSEKPFT